MADATFYKKPNKLNLANDPVIVVVRPAAAAQTASVANKLTLTFSDKTAVEDETFSLETHNELIEFTFKDAPHEGNPYELPTAQGAITLNDWVQSVANVLIREYFLDKYANITVTDNVITLEAKNEGTSEQVVYLENNVTNLAIVETISAFDGSSYTDKMFLSIIKPDGSKICEHILNTNQNDEAQLNIGDYLSAECKDLVLWPEFPGKNFLFEHASSIFAFKLVTAEVDPDSGKILKLVKGSDTFYAISGGSTREDRKYLEGENSNFYDYAYNQKRFLTWCPDGKIINSNQPEKLFFFTGDFTQLKLHCKVYYTDESIHEFDVFALSAVESNSIYEFQVGAKKLELKYIDETKTVDKYVVCLIDNTGTKVSEEKTFYVDPLEYPGEKFFIFKNSFEKWDTLRCIGEIESSANLDRTSAVTADDLGPKSKIIESAFNNTFKSNTGWLDNLCEDPEAYHNYLVELLRSPEVYEVKGDWIKPIEIISKKSAKHQSKEDLYQHEFEYQYITDEKYFSNHVGNKGFEYLLDGEGNILEDANGVKLHD